MTACPCDAVSATGPLSTHGKDKPGLGAPNSLKQLLQMLQLLQLLQLLQQQQHPGSWMGWGVAGGREPPPPKINVTTVTVTTTTTSWILDPILKLLLLLF